MYNADRSSSGRIQRLKQKTLAVYHTNNPTKNDFGGEKPSSALTLLQRTVGQQEVCDTCCYPVCDLSNAFFIPILPEGADSFEQFLQDVVFGQPISFPNPPDGFPSDRYILYLIFPEICNATTYTTSLFYNGSVLPQQQYFLGLFSSPDPLLRAGLIVIFPLADYNDSVIVNLTATNPCSTTTTEATLGCFLAGSPVAMADGTFKAIETVAIGDAVLGAFGEINTVEALHRPVLGAGCVLDINKEHKTTTHHPHVSADKKFYCAEPSLLKSFTYGKLHNVIVDKKGRTEKRKMPGLAPGRISKLEVGIELQTLTGARRVNTLDTIKMSPFTQVYHLVVGGSHTFMVDGYAVVGWAHEDDFDYDMWTVR